MTNYLTVQEAADLLKVSPKTIRRKVWSGELSAKRIGKGPRAPIRIEEQNLKKLLSPAG